MEDACDLCALAIEGEPFTLQIDEGEKRFCCNGCLEVYALLHGVGELAATDYSG